MQQYSYLASLLALLVVASAEVLPYNPTKVLLPSNASYAYIFQASTQNAGQSELWTLDFSTPLTASSSQLQTVSQTLPFLRDGGLVPYTPAIDSDGNITVIAGDCSQSAGGAQIWRFTPERHGSDENGTWNKYQTSHQELGAQTAMAGANFLANGIAFSEYVDGDGNDDGMFVFGGMCPDANSTADTWTSAAEYSNQMLTLSPGTSVGYTDYDISLVANREPPIAEAGFSITPLSPTFSEASANEPQQQQQNFVLLGGHTQAAFINMSQVALFSLPQESWAFLPVSQPSTAKTDLTARQSQADVEPRSGHTAVLTEGGESVVLFGGWVGDINTPAEPQLAVLELGSGYGGKGDWSWSMPSSSGSGLASGTGIYGHGAAMLPGDVMMVVGGYAIPAPSARSKRDGQNANSQIFFYNVSSSTWMDSYTPPSTSSQESDKDNGPLSRKSQQAGLGAGLGIGAAVLILLVVFYFWYTRRLKHAREARGRALLSRSSDGSFGQTDRPLTDTGGVDRRGGDVAAVGRFWNVWDSSADTSASRAPQMQQTGTAGSTALFVNIPSPTRGLRKGMAGRNYQYHAAPRYDDKRVSRGSANIPTITEHDEEDEWPLPAAGSQQRDLTDAERTLKELERVLNSPDPFTEAEPNPLGSHPVSPELAQDDTIRRVLTGASHFSAQPRRESVVDRAELPAWPAEASAAEPLLRLDTGRISPSKTDERTSSTLSERSNASANSITRTMSPRTGTILAVAAAVRAASNNSPEHSSSSSDGRTATMSTNGGRKSPYYYQTRARSSTNGSVQVGAPNSASTDADSFTTARTNFLQLQSEGEALLGGRPTMDRDDPYQRALAAHSSTRSTKTIRLYDEHGAAPPVPPRRRQGWMGSLRRALNAVSMGERSFSLTGSSEQCTDDQRTSSSSPTKNRGMPIGSAPRRAFSDGGTLLNQKRGQKDWEDSQWPRYRDDPDPGDWGEPSRLSLEKHEAEDDWDVEGAASMRDVQVMFTVPKARLRVVNADMDRASLRSASDGALSRTDSVKNLRREESVKTLRTRSEGNKTILASTTEEQKVDGEENVAPAAQLSDWNEKEKAA